MELGLAWAALAEGELGAAEQHQDDLRARQPGPTSPYEHQLRGWIALQRSDYDEAERRFALMHGDLISAGLLAPGAPPAELGLCAWARSKGQAVSYRERRLGLLTTIGPGGNA
jgi:hypothetical protein